VGEGLLLEEEEKKRGTGKLLRRFDQTATLRDAVFQLRGQIFVCLSFFSQPPSRSEGVSVAEAVFRSSTKKCTCFFFKSVEVVHSCFFLFVFL
jgi:hypothetical protein